MISFSNLLKKTLAAYFANFKAIMPLLAVFVIWQIIINLFSADIKTAISILPYVAAFSLIVAAFTQLLLCQTFGDIFNGKTLSASTAYKESLKRFPLFVILLILLAVMVIGGLFLALVPGIIFATWFIFLAPVLMIENTNISSTFKRSKYLVSGNFFQVLWQTALVSVLIIFIVNMATQGLAAVAKLIPPGVALPYVLTLSNIVGAFLGAFTSPIMVGFLVALYFELRKLKKEI